MKVNREQAAENRRRILAAASRLFRQEGFDGVGVDAIMKEAGLTHGGFYGHFKSKSDLAAQACAQALELADVSWMEAEAPMSALADAYLTTEHCENPGEGCLFGALSSELGRQDAGVRRTVTEGLRTHLDRMAKVTPGATPAARREKAIATWAGLVGALALARAVDDPDFAEEILDAARATFGGGPRKEKAGRRPRTSARRG